MKKIVTALCIIIAVVSLCVLSACRIDDPFVNPGGR